MARTEKFFENEIVIDDKKPKQMHEHSIPTYWMSFLYEQIFVFGLVPASFSELSPAIVLLTILRIRYSNHIPYHISASILSQ